MFGAVRGHEFPFESLNELITFVPIGLGREGSFLSGDADEVFRIGCTIEKELKFMFIIQGGVNIPEMGTQFQKIHKTQAVL